MKIIEINKCTDCPSMDHKGGFAPISYVPVCRNRPGASGPRELPHTVHKTARGTMVASPTDIIPDWCELKDA